MICIRQSHYPYTDIMSRRGKCGKCKYRGKRNERMSSDKRCYAVILFTDAKIYNNAQHEYSIMHMHACTMRVNAMRVNAMRVNHVYRRQHGCGVRRAACAKPVPPKTFAGRRKKKYNLTQCLDTPSITCTCAMRRASVGVKRQAQRRSTRR